MARILKATRAPGVIDRLELEARERARALVAEAEAAAERIRAAAEGERSEVLRAAAHAGLEEGRARAAAALAEVAAARARCLEAVEEELAVVALEVGSKVVGEALRAAPERVVALARRALEPVRARREVVLRVNPEDAGLVRGDLPNLTALLERASGLALREDASLARGDVVVETEAGRVDARIATQLALLEQAVGEVTR